MTPQLIAIESADYPIKNKHISTAEVEIRSKQVTMILENIETKLIQRYNFHISMYQQM